MSETTGAQKRNARSKLEADASEKPPPGSGVNKAKSLSRQGSIYSLTPHAEWLLSEKKLRFTFFGLLAFTVLALCCFATPSFEALRLFYTVVASSLLIWRFHYYAGKKWLFFFVELCYVNSFLLIVSLWICPDGGCTPEWQWAVYIVSQGAVAGSTFPLQMPLALHHPEAFETFFLHNSPMWVCYAIRWRFFHLESVPGILELVWLGLTRVYLPWALFSWSIMWVLPWMPDFIAGSETLSDGFIFPGGTHEDRLKGKREAYGSYMLKATAGLFLVHGVLSISGFFAAAMTFHYHYVQVAWIVAVLAGCADTGRVFYNRSADSTIPADGLATGFLRMMGAWVVIAPVYFACWYFDA